MPKTSKPYTLEYRFNIWFQNVIIDTFILVYELDRPVISMATVEQDAIDNFNDYKEVWGNDYRLGNQAGKVLA